ncbi:MAG: sodium-dependent transporter [Chloroflexi bacterium]|nr:sodium-dependent transporter [Chloroflexota bacterium]
MQSEPPERVPRRGLWSGQVGFIAATVGSAVGLGNVWRFPYMVGENGGGAFIVAYVASVLLLGAPLMMFELAAGRRYEGGVFGAFRAIAPRARFAGAVVAGVTFLILSYYSVIAGWTLGHAGIVGLGLEADFDAFAGSWASLALFVVTLFTATAIVLRGVTAGIESVARILMPTLAIMLVAMAVYALTLDGRSDALKFLFDPRFGVLAEPRVWAAAMGQAMFSLSVGSGVLVTYGAYMRRSTPIRDSTAMIGGADTAIAMIAGLAIFPIVFTFAVEPSEGIELAFDALPRMFGQLPMGRLVGTAFYVLLFFAAITSMISMMEATGASISDWTRWPRTKAVIVLALALLAVGGWAALSYSPAGLTLFGEPVLDQLDAAFGTFGLLVAGLATAVAIFWVGKQHDIADEIGAGAQGRAKSAIVFVGRYLVTGAIIVTLVASVIDAV